MKRKQKRILALTMAAALACSMPGVNAAKAEQAQETPVSMKTQEALVNMKAEKKDTVYVSETEYTDGTKLSKVEGAQAESPDGKLSIQILKSKQGAYYYVVKQQELCVLQASALGIETASADFGKNAKLDNVQISEEKKQEYALLNGKHQRAEGIYREMTFDLKVSEKLCRVYFRIYNDGVAYRYEVYGKSGEKETVMGESSEFVLPYEDTRVWAGKTSNTYEYDYTAMDIKAVQAQAGNYSVPLLADVGNKKAWVLLTEANVFNEEEPYCSSYLKTASGERNLKMTFGNKVVDVEMTYQDGAFHTPWRVAVITENLNDLMDSDLITNLNPEADEEAYHYSEWVDTAKTAWSWWSEAGDDPIEYVPQEDYIDFAAENGWEMVCLDFGWCLWENYQEKVAHLCAYAKERNVKIMLWYGVNNSGHAGWKDANGKPAYPTYSLKTAEDLEAQFAWASSVGVSAVKVDYYESDTQASMKQMQECAKLAAKHRLGVLFHGCTMPGGENRTYPNILSYEAVFGEEYHKFGAASPTIETLLTYPYTRNVAGSMDFTPAALPVASIPATAGFQLAETVVFESGYVTLASSIYAYEGNHALLFLNQLESKWEQSLLLDCEQAEPGEYAAVARKAIGEEKWLVGVMTKEKKTTALSLDFLGEGEYQARIFYDNENGSEVEYKEMIVTGDTVLKEELMENGGLGMVISREAQKVPEAVFDYYEMEQAKLAGEAVLSPNGFASGLKQVSLGYGSSNQAVLQVTVSKAGIYAMNVYYKAGSKRQFVYQVNGEEAVRTPGVCSGKNSIAKYTCYVMLAAGENQITFYNENGNFVGLDRIALGKNPEETEAVTLSAENTFAVKEGTQYQYTVYPAAEAQTNAVREADGYVGWLGGNASSYLEFKVKTEKAGGYILKLGYMTGDNRGVVLAVNGAGEKSYVCESTGGYGLDSVDYLFFPVSLKKGENTVRITNPAGYCPNIYSLGVSAEQVEVPLETGTVLTKNGMRYRLLSVDGKKKTAAFLGVNNKKQMEVRIPEKITYKKQTFLVTEVSENALKKNEKVKKVVIGKNVRKIKKNAFLGCSGLKQVVIQSEKLSSVGKNAFSGIHKKAVVRVPSSQRKNYQKWFGSFQMK